MIIRSVHVLIFSASLYAGPALAQSTRQETLEKQRAEKAKNLRPYEPGKLESTALYLEDSHLLEKLQGPNVIFPVFGLGGDTQGGGFAGGVLARHRVFGDHGSIRGLAAISIRNYQLVSGQLVFPDLAQDHLELGIGARYRHFPRVGFFGEGPDSLEEDRTSFLFEAVDYSGWATVRPVPWFEIGTRIWAIRSLKIGSGTDSRFPSTEESFDDAQAPGLSVQPDYLQADGSVEIDYRDQPGNARSGGLYRVDWSKYTDQDLDQYSFRRVEAVIQQYVPIFDKKRVFAFRANLISTEADSGQLVPFYFQPTLGGSRFLRGYTNFRFRDQNLFLLTGEYRWEAFSPLDMAIFYETGKVAPRWEDLSFKNLRNDYGIGFRFNTFRAVFLRMEIARGDEGLRVFASFSNVF